MYNHNIYINCINICSVKGGLGVQELKIPVGVSDFEKIREENYYYIDKSGLIVELLKDRPAEVALITRPRRFGKTLGMSMLESFFDIRKDSQALFEGLRICEDTELCQRWMNQYPTLFLSFKIVDGLNFSEAYGMLCSVISELCIEHKYLMDSENVDVYDKAAIMALSEGKADTTEVKNSLQTLTRALSAYYGKKVVLLMDEYDVPIAKASSHGYYQEMLVVMKGIMQALKDNKALKLAIVTGCLKLAKESIFTGTNNFVSDSITVARFHEYFGFTQSDVDQILEDSDHLEHKAELKDWYDGYRFGESDVYCPWDVMNYVRDLQYNPEAEPASYWKNTSDNAIIRFFIDYAGSNITQKLETLLAGGTITQRIDDNLTYDYLHSSEENLWSILYLTGYLTRSNEGNGEADKTEGIISLKIPNEEIRDIFKTTVIKWFDDSAKSWSRKELFEAVWSGDCELLTQEVTKLLRKTISYHDYKEDFYHAFLAGIFAGAGYSVESNKEHVEGRSDIVVRDTENGRVAIFEVKLAGTLKQMESKSVEAVGQIENRMYAKDFKDDYDQILCYGIAFFRKRGLVKRKQI